MQQQLGKIGAALLQLAQACAKVVAVVDGVKLLKELRQSIAQHFVLIAHEFRETGFFRPKALDRV